MMRLLCSCLVTLLSTACVTSTPVERRLDALMSDLHQRGLFDGAVVVGDGERIVWERGFGLANVEERVPFTPSTNTDSGSLAKTFTAAVLIDLEREGVLDLDDPAQKWLPELPYPDITLRHLLSHSSGFTFDYDYFDPFLSAGQDRTTERLLAVVAAQKPELSFPPGTAFEYSGFGFDLASLAAARATKKEYGQLLRERVFAPRGMGAPFLRPARLAAFPQPRTRGYRRVNGKLEPHEVFDYEAFHGGSNIYASARDFHRWNTSSFAPEALQYARIAGAESGLTLGSWYRSAAGDAYWYAGHLQGFHDEVFRAGRWSIVYVSNNTLEPWLQHAIVRAIHAIVRGKDVPPLTPPAVQEVSKDERASLDGTWRLDGGETLAIERTAVLHNGIRYRMIPVSPRAFYVPGLHLMLGFAKDPRGAIARIHVSSNLEERWGVRYDPARE